MSAVVRIADELLPYLDAAIDQVQDEFDRSIQVPRRKGGNEKVVFLYVQTWVISKGKTREHDETVKKILQYGRTLVKEGKAPKHASAGGRHFSQRYGPMGARVMTMEFDDQAHYQKFWEHWNKDKEFNEMRKMA